MAPECHCEFAPPVATNRTIIGPFGTFALCVKFASPPADSPYVLTKTTQTRSDPREGANGSDRRRSTREPVATLGRIMAVDGPLEEPPQEVLVTDVSLHGAGFRSSQRLEMGRKYRIEIGVGPLHLTSRLVVVRSIRRRDGMFDIGGEFC